jgi:hypothetical protein
MRIYAAVHPVSGLLKTTAHTIHGLCLIVTGRISRGSLIFVPIWLRRFVPRNLLLPRRLLPLWNIFSQPADILSVIYRAEGILPIRVLLPIPDVIGPVGRHIPV